MSAFVVVGDGEARHLGDPHRALPDDVHVEVAAVRGDGLAQLRRLGVGAEVAAALLQFLFQLVADREIGDDGALGGAERAPVERGPREDVGGGLREVRRAVDVGRDVAAADAVGGLPLRVRRADHRPAAGGEDHVGVFVFEDFVRPFERDLGHAAEQALGRARRVRRLSDDAERLGRARLRAGVRAHHDPAPRLRRNNRLIHRRRRRIRARDERGDDAHRRGDFPDRAVVGLLDDAGRPHPAHPLVQRPRGEEVLLALALGLAEAGLIVGHLPEPCRLARARLAHRVDDAIDLLLAGGGELFLRGVRPLQEVTGLLDRAEVGVHRGAEWGIGSERTPKIAPSRQRARHGRAGASAGPVPRSGSGQKYGEDPPPHHRQRVLPPHHRRWPKSAPVLLLICFPPYHLQRLGSVIVEVPVCSPPIKARSNPHRPASARGSVRLRFPPPPPRGHGASLVSDLVSM